MIPDDLMLKRFQEIYQRKPEYIVRAPGRVNLIGEHTDYNGGFVLPAAINREMKIAVNSRADYLISLHSGNFDEGILIRLDQPLEPVTDKKWANYFLAVVDQFIQRGIGISGMEVLIQGDVPLGAGLSSSAAYEVCVATLLNQMTHARLSPRDLALISQAAEHSRFVGVRCGIMDQFISALGAREKALKVDCYSLDYELVPMDSTQAVIVIINSMKKRGLVDSEYNQRREECETGLERLRELGHSQYPTLRHVPMSVFEEYQGQLPPLVAKRVKHNLTENLRVEKFAQSLKDNNYTIAGELLYQSHASLKDDFEVSCKELDDIVAIAKEIPGVLGCRMTGAGFGGCAVALVSPHHVEGFTQSFTDVFYKRYAVQPDIYISMPEQGASIREM